MSTAKTDTLTARIDPVMADLIENPVIDSPFGGRSAISGLTRTTGSPIRFWPDGD